MQAVIDALNEAFTPPPKGPAWKWCEDNILMDHTSPFQGKYSTAFTPMVRAVMDACQKDSNKKVVVLCSAQSAKTQTLMNFVAWVIKNDPGPMFWVMAAQDDVRDFAKTRLLKMLSEVDTLKDLMPKDREANNIMLMMFPTMNLMFRGSNSKSKLQSTPVRWLILDEVRNYAKGALELVLKRVRAWWNSRIIMISTPGDKHDEIHRAFVEGSQTYFHFTCPHCKRSQPFRFGRDSSPMFVEPRQRGGLRWATDDTTRPNGVWNFEELRKTVRYECEECGHMFHEGDRWPLIQTLHQVSRNQLADVGVHSYCWNAMYVPWIKWSDIAIEFIQADMAYRRGKLEPLKAFVRETLGEPWEERGDRPREHELRRQCGANYGDPYVRKEPWNGETTALVLTADVQAAHGGFVKWLVRQWKPNGDSRLVDFGQCMDFDELRDIQLQFHVQDQHVFLDSGYRASMVYKACATWGWGCMKGDDKEAFIVHMDKRPHRMPYKLSVVDPSLGKEGQGRQGLQLIHWSNPAYKDRLLLHIALGRGPIWELPDDVSLDYLMELVGEERQAKEDSRGVIVFEWVKVGPNDWLDCELMQLVVADLGGLAVTGELPAQAENSS
jgi:hypothetical protein